MPARARGPPSERTSRCCSPKPATRTARRWARGSCATNSSRCSRRPDLDLAGVGLRAPAAPPREARARAREIDAGGEERLPGRGRQGDAAPVPAGADRRATAARADAPGRPHAPRRHDRGAVHPPRPPPRGRLPGPSSLPARALPRTPAGHLHLDPVRRRRAPLPGRELCAAGDEAGHAHGARGGRAAGQSIRAPSGSSKRDLLQPGRRGLVIATRRSPCDVAPTAAAELERAGGPATCAPAA